MPRLHTTQTNFASGELDPLMGFRSDTGAYRNGAKTLLNCLLYNTGGCARRPGFEHLASLNGQCRLVPFEFAYDEQYVLALSNARLDVYDLDGTLLTSVTSGCNWTTATLFELTYTQVADTMVVAHQDWMMQVIERTGASSFTVSDFEFAKSTSEDVIYQPYYKYVDADVDIACSATTGSVTVTASHGVFTSDMVGQRLRWKQTELEVTAYTDTYTLTATVKGTLKGEYIENPFRVTNGSTTVKVTHVGHGFANSASVTIAGAVSVGGVPGSDLNATHTITLVDDNHYEITVATAATDSVDGGGPSVTYTGANLATRDWGEQVVCERNGYPAAVCFHEGRLWFAGTGGIPDGLWSSKIYQYFNFDVGDGEATDSIQVTVGADDISSVRHLVSNSDLQIYTATGDFYAPAPRDSSLTPANISIRRQTPYGASKVMPQPFDGATVYVQSAGTALRELIYNEVNGRYNSTNLNVLAQHIVDTPQDLAVLYGGTERSEQYAFMVNNNGTMAVFHSARSEELAGWTKWQLGGEGSPVFSSVMSIGDAVYASVYRHSTYRLERMSSSVEKVLDGYEEYTSGTATASWTLNSIFYNRTVQVVSGNYYMGEFTVGAAGELTLPEAVTDIRVGYDYDFEITTLPVEIELATGPVTGLPKRISRVQVGIYSTLSLSISGNKLLLRQVDEDLSEEPTALSGTYEFRLLGYQRDAVVTLTQTEPLPVRVLGMMMEVQL